MRSGERRIVSGVRTRIAYVLAFPVVLTIGIVLIPVVTNYDDHALAEQAVNLTTRWFFGHIIAALGFAVAVLAVSAIDSHLRESQRGLPAMTLPFITLGAGLYAAGLGADGIGPLAVRSAGYSPVIFFDGGNWVTGIFVAGTTFFGIGLIRMTGGAIQIGFVQGPSRYIVFISALIFLVAPAILSGWALYGVAVAAFGVFVPFALAMSSRWE